MTAREDAIRKLLNEEKHEGGLSVSDVADALDFPLESTRQHLRKMPDVYIDRWCMHSKDGGGSGGGRPFSIHCAVRVPKDCPPPMKKAERRRMKKP